MHFYTHEIKDRERADPPRDAVVERILPVRKRLQILAPSLTLAGNLRRLISPLLVSYR